MSLVVTLQIFSGRPNPVWVIPDEGEIEFNDRLARITSSARTSSLKPASVMGGLGYRGFTVQSLDGTQRIAIYSGVIDPGRHSVTFLPDDRELERWLLTTGTRVISEGVLSYMDRELKGELLQGPIILQYPPTLACPVCMAQDAPLLELSFWSYSSASSADNNCYNYATDRMTNTIAQPGRASGYLFTQLNGCSGVGSVQDAAIFDGLVACSNFSDPLPAGGGWYVALVLWPGHDFHWYRQDSKGCWSQKMGGNDASSFDNSHHSIKDPKAADRGPYTTFCSYMVTKCCLKIR
ncbi:hypothetical protein BH10ACI4_BH10ACI4_35680 [soil metagenome]